MQDEAVVAFENAVVRVEVVGTPACLWRLTVLETGRSIAVGPPAFEVDGKSHPCALTRLTTTGTPMRLAGDRSEYRVAGTLAGDPDLSLELVLRVADDSPVVRFRYILRCAAGRLLTEVGGTNALTYLRMSFADFPTVTEIRLAEFVELAHSYCLAEHAVDGRHFAHELNLIGPLLAGSDGGHSMLVGYEHGSQAPDAFLAYGLGHDRVARLAAVKGNYTDGRPLRPELPFETVWLQAAVLRGDMDALAGTYRDFVLRHMSTRTASRAPLIFYNSWALQERSKWWHGDRYLDPMHEERMLQEIEIAHKMGVDVFVLDTGWYDKTGDWAVNRTRFTNGLGAIKERLDGYGMRLGLWLGPTSAALSSRLLRDHTDCVMTWHGKAYEPQPVWETEASARMCLVSRYADAFADELIRLTREVGVTYFKWDAVGQYGCDNPGHEHGTADNSPRERADSYAFELVHALTRIVERVCAVYPEVIVDFDVTEGGRAVGLGFLAAGKYFLINNGPYYQSFDVPVDPETQNTNLFFYPGQARNWICRTPLDYDRWIPSILFLTHYLPDGPASSQLSSLASLILGQNGIWGDLTAVSREGVALFGNVLGRYKQVRADITAAAPVRAGRIGGSPEVHEKVHSATGRGVVVMFATSPGRYSYVTMRDVSPTWWATDGVTVARDPQGRARIDALFTQPGAVIVLFGATANPD